MVDDESWPLSAVRITWGELTLCPAGLDDVDALADAIHSLSIDEHRFVPNLAAHALAATPAETARNVAQRIRDRRATIDHDDWGVPFTVRHRARVVGSQSIRSQGFAVTRTVHSGSYLHAGVRSQGIGTAMRRMVAEFCFAGLEADTMMSGFAVGNVASERVSQRLGYERVGDELIVAGEFEVTSTKVWLSRDRWRAHRPSSCDEITMCGLDEARERLAALR
jgi:RimJ/RimL family protein N-acetyltransferase